MRKKIYFLLEIVIWFILLSGLICFGYKSIENYLIERKTYNLTFKDVDGLIVGSPVRMMGIQVGHVIKIKPMTNNVDITFVITRNDVNIPDNSTVNIQFTGLAGSKSLEILPLSSDIKYDTPFQVIEPIRITSVLDVNQDITKSILDCSKMALNMLGNGGYEQIKNNIKLSSTVSSDIKNAIINMNKSITNANKIISDKSINMQDQLLQGSSLIDNLNDSYFNNPKSAELYLINNLKSLYLSSSYIERNDWDKYLIILNRRINNSRQNLRKSEFYLNYLSCNSLDSLYNTTNSISQGCHKVNSFIETNLSSDSIKKLHHKTQSIKKLTID